MLAFVEFLERNVGVLSFGLLCFVLGIFIQGGFAPDVDRVASQVRGLDETVASLSEAESARGEALRDLTASLQDLGASMQDLNAAFAEQRDLTGGTRSALTELGDRLSSVESAVAEIGGTVAAMPEAVRSELVPVLRRAAAAATSPSGEPTGGAVGSDAAQTITLTIGESSWIVDGRVSAALAYVYPGGGAVRIGIANALHDLSVEDTVDVNLADRSCAVGLVGTEGRTATLTVTCQDPS